jgi:hypothetical protein
VEINKQIDAIQGVESANAALPKLENDWTPPALRFWCKEHERIADAFFGLTAETLTGAEALSRRIQVVNNLAVLCELREPPKRGPKLDWSRYNKDIDLEGTDISTTNSSDNVTSEDASHVADLCFPSNRCMFCVGDTSLRTFLPRLKQRPDALRRHFENQHLSRLIEHVDCPHPVCKEQGIKLFPNREVWLNHAAMVHKYDLKIQLSRLSGQ